MPNINRWLFLIILVASLLVGLLVGARMNAPYGITRERSY